MLTGLRGVGKTVLLHEMAKIAHRHGWRCESFEAAEDFSFENAMATLARRAMLRLSAGRRAADSVRRALGVLSSFQACWRLADGAEVMVGVDPVAGRADSGALDLDLTDLFVEVAELARDRGAGVLFTVDEVQYLAREQLASLIMALHRVSQLQLPLTVAVAGLPSAPALAGEAKSYAERLFAFVSINSLEEDAAVLALQRPATDEGVSWAPSALDTVIAATKGYPYFIQEFGKHAWDVAPGPDRITASDVEEAMPLAIAELDSGFFRVRLDRTTDGERAYIRAMGSLGGGPYRSGDVASALGRTTPQVGQHRDALIRRGLCYSPRHGVIDFTVPMFDDFVRRSLTEPVG